MGTGASNRTIISTDNRAETPRKKKLPLFIGGGGCLLFLCLLLLAGGAFFAGSGKLSALIATATPTTTETAPPSATFTPTYIPTRTPTPAKPAIGAITFAPDATADLQPVGPAQSFKPGVTKIHALFDYRNFTKDDTWERVWLLDGTEMLRSAEPWSGDARGTFDYFLDADGQPLPAGEWTLEIYLNGDLLASDSFAIKADTPTTTPTSKLTTATATPSPTITPTPTAVSDSGVYQLAYTKWDGHFHNVYIADTNGHHEKFIASRVTGPSFSRDGKQLFFYGEEGVDHQERSGEPGCEFGTISNGIVAIDLSRPLGDVCHVKTGAWFCERKEGSNQIVPRDVCVANGVRVFQNLDWKVGSARWASVAPDGDSVAFDAKPGGDYRIYFRSIFDNQQYRFEIVGEQADWSPNSQKLVYRSGRDNKQGIWISGRDDSNPKRITDGGSDSFPAWSPDASTVAFSRDVGGNVDIYLVSVNGGNLRRLTTAPGPDTLPVFTPGGDIIFRSARSGSWGIWKMTGSGGNQRQIIADAGVGPDWAYSKMDAH